MMGRSFLASMIVALLLVTIPVGSAMVADSSEAPSEIRMAVEDVLSRPAYTGIGQNPMSSFLRSNPVSRWITEQVQRFIEWLSGFGGSDPTVPSAEQDPQRSSGLVSILILTIVLTVGVAYLIGSRRDRDDLSSDAEEAQALLSGSEMIRLARRAEESGDYEQAVRLRFQAGLRALDRAGVIEASPSTATGTVRREVALDEFDAVANVFEVATYSEYEATAGDAEAARSGWDDVFRVIDRFDEQGDSA